MPEGASHLEGPHGHYWILGESFLGADTAWSAPRSLLGRPLLHSVQAPAK